MAEAVPIPTQTELAGSPVESRAIDKFSAVRKFKVAWSDRVQFMNDMLEGNSGFGLRYPFELGSQAFAKQCKAVPFGEELGTSDPNTVYNDCIITVTYETPGANDPASSTGRTTEAISESFEPWVENIILGHEGFRWKSGSGEPITPSQAPSKTVYGTDYIFTRHRLRRVPHRAFKLQGHVDAQAISTNFSKLSFAKETVLFKGFSVQRTVRLNSANTWRVVYRFGIREHGWNKFWLPNKDSREGGSWEHMYVEGSNHIHRVFPLGNL